MTLLPIESINQFLLLGVVFFFAAIASELLRDDMKYVLQTIALICGGALFLLSGIMVESGAVSSLEAGTVQVDYVGVVLMCIGGMFGLPIAFRVLSVALKPFEGGADQQISPRSPKKPLQPGGG